MRLFLTGLVLLIGSTWVHGWPGTIMFTAGLVLAFVGAVVDGRRHAP